MAQLPPKIPHTMTSNWPDYHNKFFLHNNPPPPAATTNLSWVDEFLDFSSTRRASHRRSISDSDIAFSKTHEFDKIDDEQFLSMFGDDKHSRQSHHALSSSPTNHEEKFSSLAAEQRPPEMKNEPEEVQMSRSEDSDTEASQREASAGKRTEMGTDSGGERITDPKRVKRILANRQSAQRSRVRKMQYVSDLERSVNSLQAEVSVLSPRVAFLDHQRLLLNVDNSAIKQRIAALAQDKIFKDAHQEALKKEIERLKKVYEQQQQRSRSSKVDVENNNGAAAATSPVKSSRTEKSY